LKKKWLMTALMGGLLLAACDNPTEDTDPEDPIVEEKDAIQDEEPGEAIVTDEEMEPVSDDELEQAEVVDDLSQYEEFEAQDVFVPDDLEARLITDDSTSRVIVFLEDDQQVFKSTFMKEENLLTIVDFIDNELIMNGPI